MFSFLKIKPHEIRPCQKKKMILPHTFGLSNTTFRTSFGDCVTSQNLGLRRRLVFSGEGGERNSDVKMTGEHIVPFRGQNVYIGTQLGC